MTSFILTLGFISCPEINVDYFSNDAGAVENIASWEACAQECEKRSNCHAWSWITNQFPNPSLQKNCLFKNDNWKSDRKVMEHVISGEKNCLRMISLLSSFYTTLRSMWLIGHFRGHEKSDKLWW